MSADMKPVIQVRDIGKCYRIGHAYLYGSLRERIVDSVNAPFRKLADRFRGRTKNGARSRYEDVWALKGVSFDVMPGEVVGMVGRNGAGKSTLLKILSRITEPTTGRIELYGRVGSLLEVGTGFHQELTGRENVFLSGAILGMRRSEIQRKFDEIVAFAEVEKFIDTPVKRYSSGMYLRLAFAVAAHLEAEILVVDEVLAVGDVAFQKKCLGKIGDVARGGRTVLFVSHNTVAIESLCSSCLLLADGRLKDIGSPSEIIGRYMASQMRSDVGVCALHSHSGRQRGSIPTMTEVELQTEKDAPGGAIRMASSLTVKVSYAADRPLRPVLGVAVKTTAGVPVFVLSDRSCQQLRNARPLSHGTVTCIIEECCLMPGGYTLDLYFGDAEGDFDIIHDAISLEVLPADVHGNGRLPSSAFGPVFCSAKWELEAGGSYLNRSANNS
jgi:lipopolysaccharide transport system ATP-binding protein